MEGTNFKTPRLSIFELIILDSHGQDVPDFTRILWNFSPAIVLKGITLNFDELQVNYLPSFHSGVLNEILRIRLDVKSVLYKVNGNKMKFLIVFLIGM